MVVKKTYTNADIIQRLDDMTQRLTTIEDWKRGIEIGKAAVDEYKNQEAAEHRAKTQSTILDGVKDMLPYIMLVLAGAVALIYAYASRSK